MESCGPGGGGEVLSGLPLACPTSTVAYTLHMRRRGRDERAEGSRGVEVEWVEGEIMARPAGKACSSENLHALVSSTSTCNKPPPATKRCQRNRRCGEIWALFSLFINQLHDTRQVARRIRNRSFPLPATRLSFVHPPLLPLPLIHCLQTEPASSAPSSAASLASLSGVAACSCGASGCAHVFADEAGVQLSAVLPPPKASCASASTGATTVAGRAGETLRTWASAEGRINFH